MHSKLYAAFVGAVFIGGANFIAVSFSNMELPPLFGAALRFGLASAVFVLIARAWHAPWPREQAAAGAAIYGLLGFGTSYALLYYALLGLAAGKVAVIVATVPLFTLAIAVLFGQERLSVRGIVGSVMVVLGIAVLSLGTLGGAIGSTYLLAAILGAIAVAASSVLVKALPNVHPVSLNAIGMAAGTLLLALGSLLLGERWALPRETPTLLAVAWLVLLGSLGLFQLFLYVIRRWSASATVYAVAGMPVVAAGLGTLMLGQPVTVEVAVGGMLVIAAVYVGAIAKARTLPDVPLPEGATLMTEASSEEPATP
jgi:drug/metabolite transporter (DMT)-like permease